jgi:hypothetical protein
VMGVIHIATWFEDSCMVYYAKRPDLRQERETSNTVCLEFTGDVERIRKWGRGVAVCQTLSMNAPKGERDIYLNFCGPKTGTPRPLDLATYL